MGVVLSDSGFSGYLTVAELIPIQRALYPAFEERWFREKLDRFSLPLKKKLKELSTGMKAKLKLLVALSHRAKLLILDEPTAGLDVIARDELLLLLKEYMDQEDCSILISSHISSDLESLCDDVYMIQGGKIVLHEDTDVLLGSYGLLKASPEQYQALDRRYLLSTAKESYGYLCLTDQKQFYMENYPSLAVEKGSIDGVITALIKGGKQ